jgi:hypothetical protein
LCVPGGDGGCWGVKVFTRGPGISVRPTTHPPTTHQPQFTPSRTPNTAPNQTPKQAARGIQSLRSALGIVEEEAAPDALATMYIHGRREGYCGLCGACLSVCLSVYACVCVCGCLCVCFENTPAPPTPHPPTNQPKHRPPTDPQTQTIQQQTAVDSVAGPGAESCDIQESCNDLMTPFNTAGKDTPQINAATALLE